MAREVVNFQEFLAKLHPSLDDCPSPCALTIDDERPKDLADFCESCEVRAQFEFFEEAARRELSRRFAEGECEWSFAELYEDVLEALRLARRKGHPRGCDALTAKLIDICRREQRRPERIRSWELSQKVNSNASG
jgi:hypothetical protein